MQPVPPVLGGAMVYAEACIPRPSQTGSRGHTRVAKVVQGKVGVTRLSSTKELGWSLPSRLARGALSSVPYQWD